MRTRALVASGDHELLEELDRARFEVVRCPGGVAEARERAQAEPFDLVVGEATRADVHAWGTLLAHDPALALVLIGDAPSAELALGALRAGASELLHRPLLPGDLAGAATTALDRRRGRLDRLRDLRDQLALCVPSRCVHLQASRAHLAAEAARRQRSDDELSRWRIVRQLVPRLPQELAEAGRFEELLGASPAVRGLCDQLARAARCEAPVLLIGETGTGKELCARAIHSHGARAAGPAVALNCAALPVGLLESELFGHARGAFTDAREPRAGLLQQASGGTLFLDEVGDMPLGVQAKLLRALQEQRVRPVGSDREVPVDLRLIAATHCDLEEAVREGRFREDLLYRINVIRIDVPPLRARGEDVLLLAQHFLTTLAARTGKPVRGMSTAVAERLLAYDWPGNVRELRNCIERAVAMTSHDQLVPEDLPSRVREHEDGAVALAEGETERLLPLAQVERHHVLRVLERMHGNKARAARVLGLSRKTLYRMLERYSADSSGFRLPLAGASRAEAEAPPGD